MLNYVGKEDDAGITWVTLEDGNDTWQENAQDWSYILDLAGSLNGGTRCESYYRHKDGRVAYEKP